MSKRMERYGGGEAVEGAPVDPMVEWASPSGETGLEEPMWELGLGGGIESYPERPGEPDCGYYLKTGFCGYGARCRFSHPRDRSAVKAFNFYVSNFDLEGLILTFCCRIGVIEHSKCWVLLITVNLFHF
ncbi:zinc finger CCCH domain-containing protein 34-like isoform X1 [Olea europaea var. sylvestris]|uniref:zinc finger CCCH domain-containing protein 34-like isoform X1 n=1 Tax=Olea europaea var. sylvestris TaxID=158386 RepID=UPI000C1CDF8F|nr:zinc finger CCCH domain-containing protein 34-like isoform X1 [Olea europaea var. sylvestris]